MEEYRSLQIASKEKQKYYSEKSNLLIVLIQSSGGEI
jgi:hypothetical protein